MAIREIMPGVIQFYPGENESDGWQSAFDKKINEWNLNTEAIRAEKEREEIGD